MLFVAPSRNTGNLFLNFKNTTLLLYFQEARRLFCFVSSQNIHVTNLILSPTPTLDDVQQIFSSMSQ